MTLRPMAGLRVLRRHPADLGEVVRPRRGRVHPVLNLVCVLVHTRAAVDPDMATHPSCSLESKTTKKILKGVNCRHLGPSNDIIMCLG